MNQKSELIDQLRIDDAAHPEASSGRLSRVAWVLLPLLVLLGAAIWLWQRPSVPAVVLAAAQPVAVGASAQRDSVLDASGYIVARRQATVSSEVTGKIAEVLVEEGMRVSEGQVLARLDDATERAQLALARAELTAARAALSELEVQLADARRSFRRQQDLVARKLTSQAQYDEALATVESLEARLAARRTDIGVAERSVRLREQLVSELTITAPFSGVVIAKAAQPGEMVSPISAGGGFTRTGICTIVDMESLEIEVDVNEAYIDRVSEGQSTTAVLDAYPEWQIPARVIAIVPTADRQKATVRVRVGLLEADSRILPDMGVQVRFFGSEADRAPIPARPVAAVEIPAAAVTRDNGRSYIFVWKDGVVERRAVERGEQRQGRIVVTAGLSGGELVVADLDGLSLRDGQAVRRIGG
jgi:RND family efflux transporter MFP subunit